MKHTFLCLILWTTISWGIESPVLTSTQNQSFPTIVRVYFEEAAQLQPVSDRLDMWAVNADQRFAVVYLQDEQELNWLLAKGLPLRADQHMINNWQQGLEQSTRATNGSGIPGFSCYGTVAETFQRMDQMVNDHPDLAAIIDIGDSWEKQNLSNAGSDLKVLQLTNQNIPGDKPILFMASSIHAREYTTAELNTRFAEHLLSQYGVDADVTWILDHHEIQLSLITNPDGREQAQTGILWRKNTNQSYCSPNSNDRGVDLNRNYPFQWDIGGSSNECSETYRGPAAATEPEISAQMNHLRQIFDDNRGTGPNDAAPADTPGIFIDIHSFSELMLWPWGYTNNNTANDNQLQALGKRTAWFNQYRPQPVNDLVITGGGSIDAIYGELGVASLAFELGTAFFQDCATFESTIYPDNLQALIYLARVAQLPYQQPLGPDIEQLTVIPNVVTSASQLLVSGVANDDRYNQSNGAQTTGNVQTVTAYLNQLPIKAISGQALTAVDGAFDETAEAFSGTINSQGLPLGQHLIYVQASDGTHEGGTYARFVDVVEASQVARLSGSVTDALTGLPIDQALLTINQSQALSQANGSYQQFIKPGTADLVVSAAEYATLTLDNLTLSAGDELTQNIELQPFCDVLNDDVESGSQLWQSDNPWAISNEQSASPTHAWTDSPGGNYSDDLNISLMSQSINIASTDRLELSYMSLCDTEAGYDYGYTEVQFDGGNWQQLNRCDNQNNWQPQTHLIEPPVNSTQLRIRFRLETDGSVTRDGWYLDDFRLRTSGAACEGLFNDLIFANNFEVIVD
ncbi:M14 family zinc carboxypeptidase [Marinicella sediminis]|uniref:M14 family zinc carboxypeptidase n=1 Tax=Marinicella sediminis TaxID=1792834 RepID=A0ABV7J8C0_9GAMM|nr:M14 family zinc carboxypeptidase [Marinicella sediminis]